jgi:hypothetical protein
MGAGVGMRARAIVSELVARSMGSGDYDLVRPDDARTRLREATALWNVGYGTAADVVDAACDALVAGVDGPSLRMLAGVMRRHADSEVPEHVEAALVDVGLHYHQRGSRDAEEAAIRVLAARVVAGALEPEALTVWARIRYGHDAQPLAERLVELDEVYDIREQSGRSTDEVDADVLEEAQRILQTGPA